MIRRSPGRSRNVSSLSRRRGRSAPRTRQRPESRLEGAGHPHLAPDGWAVGRPVRDFLREGPLPTAEAAAVGLAVLSALGALHPAGRVHGGVSEDSVGVAADGWIRLAAEAARDERRGPAGDIEDTGILICRLLGVRRSGDVRLPADGAERTAAALVAVARSLANDPGRWTAEEAWLAVKEAAGYSGSEPQLVRALADLAGRVDGTTPLQRAVTRVVIGPPLRAEPLPQPRSRRELMLPDLRLRPALPPMTAPKVAAPKVSLPKLAAPSLPKLRPGARFLVIAGGLALALGLLAGGLAGARAALPQARKAAAAAPAKPKPAPGAVRPPAPAGLYAQTPSAAVSMFFQLVRDQKLDQAALLWKPKMAAAVDLRSRFGGITGIDLRRADIVAEDDSQGIATVEVDWVETRADGSTHEYIGEIYTDTGPVLWRWDSWSVHEVTPDGGAGAGGGDGG